MGEQAIEPVAGRTPISSRLGHLASAAFGMLVVAPLMLAAMSGSLPHPFPAGFIDIDMRATGGTTAQLFWTSDDAFSERDSTTVPLHSHGGEFEQIRFPLPAARLKFLRFDPLDGPGEILIRSITVRDAQGRPLHSINPILLTPGNQIAVVAPGPQGVRIVTTPEATDPILLLPGQWLAPRTGLGSLRFVTLLSLGWIAAAVLALVIVGLALVGRDVVAHRFGAGEAGWLAALFLVVVAAKLALLRHFPMPVPFWDQWDAEAANLYLPFADGGLSWQQMFALHNEHRLFFTRLLAMVGLALDGQWDPQLQMVANLVIQATTSVLLASIMWLAAGRRRLGGIAAVVALAVAPPFGLENTLAGFQSQFVVLVLFLLIALWLMGAHRVGSRAWFVGWTAAFCTTVTTGGGFLSVTAIGCVVVLALLADVRAWRQAAVNLVALSAVALVGYLGMAPAVQGHAYLKAGTWAEFGLAFARNLAFPWMGRPAALMLVWLPLGVLAALVLVRRGRTGRWEQYACALGGWIVVQAAVMAYGRGAGGAVPASRYLDTLSLGLVANAMALLFLHAQLPRSRWPTRVGWALMTVWIGMCALGVVRVSGRVVAAIGSERRSWMRAYVANLRAFITAGDPAAIRDKQGPLEIPYPNAARLMTWLGDPYIRRILPAQLREPLPIRPASDTTDTFGRVAGGTEVAEWDSFRAGGAEATGRFESAAVRCSGLQYLRMEVSGEPSTAGLRLVLKSAGTGLETTFHLAPGPGWRAGYVRCPEGSFTLNAEDSSKTSSVGFRAPVEVGMLSMLAETLIQRSSAISLAAAGLSILALANAAGLIRRRET